MTSDSFQYVGRELDVFSLAANWKRYWSSKIEPYLGRRVLEVGAGIGSTTRQLVKNQYELWVGLEPDETMADSLIRQKEQDGIFPTWCEFRKGTVTDFSKGELFDSIIYIDVLEHIKDDQRELEHAAKLLDKSGHLTVLSPAYPYLFTEFDEAIGHYRRYTKKTLPTLEHAGLKQIKVLYLDSIGLITSLANKFILHSSQPSASQIKFWDNYIIPISRVIDPIHRYSLGRSIVAVWQKI